LSTKTVNLQNFSKKKYQQRRLKSSW